MRAKTLAVIAVLGLVSVACGADDTTDTMAGLPETTEAVESTTHPVADTTEATETTSASGSETDAIAVCPMLTAEEVGTVLDSPGQGEEDAMLAPLYSCSWTDSSSRELVLSVAQAPSPAEAQALYGIELEGSEELTGLGDAARLHPDYFVDGAEISVVSGAFYITLAITEIDDDHALVPLLEAVLTRLP